MIFSKFGNKFTRPNGITQLMDDLGKANSSDNADVIMLGGGNPAIVPEAHAIFVDELQQVVASDKVDQMLSLYDGPEGNDGFRQSLAGMLKVQYGWDISEDNIALSNGSQSNFFTLFNLLAGEMEDGSQQKVLLPLAPEYVGYADQGLAEDMFVSIKPSIHSLENNQFKYEIDFTALNETLKSDQRFGAICISRPTNPTGNVITDDELSQLDVLARQYNIPLMIDSAYGHPFPSTIYTDATLIWNENIILCMSLSKLGLPGLRTGIVIANKEIVNALGRLNGIMILAPNSVGPTIMTNLIKAEGYTKLPKLCNNIIKPYYQQKADTAVALFNEVFAGLPVYLHKLEGAFFMWLWFKDMGINSEDLYEKLKEDNVYVIPGHNFFIGIEDDWAHKHQCIRVNYAKDEEMLRVGLELIKRAVSV